MAWITKDSANARFERRDEPYFTSEMRERMTREYLPRYETRLGAVMPALHMVQHAYGWVPPQAMEEIAAFLGLSPAEVLDTASFYEEYWLKPRGKHLVSVCRSIACEFCGQPEVTEAIKRRLKIEVGETTDDEQFTLIELECIGACGGAPAMLVDETLHEHVSPEKVGEILDDASRHGGSHH